MNIEYISVKARWGKERNNDQPSDPVITFSFDISEGVLGHARTFQLRVKPYKEVNTLTEVLYVSNQVIKRFFFITTRYSLLNI